MPQTRFPAAFLTVAAPLAVVAIVAASARAGPVRIGVLGDSVVDEYRFPVNLPPGGDRRSSRNLVELLSEQRGVYFGEFTTASRGTPRNQGYAFNWALDGSTTAGLAEQTAGLAPQVAAGQVDLGFVFIGGNDFRGLFAPGADPAAIVQNALTDTATAVGTLLAADPDFNVVLSNVPDITLLPEAQFALAQDPSLEPAFAQVSGLIDQYNALLDGQFAGNGRVAIIDTNGLFDEIITGGQNEVGGVTLDVLNPGDGAGHLFVDSIHPGTIGQGLLANEFIEAADGQFGAGIGQFSERELVAAAVPVPAAVWTALAAMPFAAAAFRRMRRSSAA